MPKPFIVKIQVEEIALGRVMRVLQKTPGVISFDFRDMDDPNANGAHPSKGKPKNSFELTGADYMLRLLAKTGPVRSTALKEAFGKNGRAPTSIASVLHGLKGEGLITNGKKGYALTKKARDRMRSKKEAKP